MESLAEVNMDQGMHQTAISMFNETWEAYEQEYENGHTVQCRSMAFLARLKAPRGELQEATTLEERVLEL